MNIPQIRVIIERILKGEMLINLFFKLNSNEFLIIIKDWSRFKKSP